MSKLEEYIAKLKSDIKQCEDMEEEHIKQSIIYDCLDKRDFKTSKMTHNQKINAIRLYIDELKKELNRIEMNEKLRLIEWEEDER